MFRRISIVTMLAIIFAVFCVSQSFAGEIKLGIMVPTTGSVAAEGKTMENAMKMAVKEINAKGGILGNQVVTVTGDDACDPQQGAAAASKLISEGVVGVVGGYCSGSTLPTLKLYGDAGIPLIIPAANSTKLIPANQGNAFLINSTGADQSDTAVMLFKKLGVKNLSVVHMGDAYSEDLAKLSRDKWEKEGTVVSFDVINQGEQDFSALAFSIKRKKSDAVFWTAYYSEGALLIKQLRGMGYNGIIAVGDGSNNVKLIEIGGKAAEGVYCFSNPTADYLPGAKQFSMDYKEQFNQAPGAYSPLSYDGMYLMADAIEKAGSTDQKAIIEALKNTKGFKGIAGSITFTPENTLAESNFVVLKVQDGKFGLEK